MFGAFHRKNAAAGNIIAGFPKSFILIEDVEVSQFKKLADLLCTLSFPYN